MLAVTPQDDYLKAEPGEAGRSVLKVEAEGPKRAESEAKPSVLTSWRSEASVRRRLYRGVS